MFSTIRRAVDSLAVIASRLDRISVALEDMAELQYRDAGLTRTAVVLPPPVTDKEAAQAVVYATDASSYEEEQANLPDFRTSVGHA